mmetsp:Transcript_29375/g.37993  ORF Transcript_29375/g.37993 Transcript_29375/m.37993 type:complete len:205 (-) Transcript_29375:232-846(-)
MAILEGFSNVYSLFENQGTSKEDALQQVFDIVFLNRNACKLPTSHICTLLATDIENATEVCLGVLDVIGLALDAFPSEEQGWLGEEGNMLEEGIRKSVEKVLSARVPLWREACIAGRPGLPKFQGVSCSIQMGAASSQVTRLAQPHVAMALQVQDQESHESLMPGSQTINFELNRETLNTLLAGMNKIKDQLAATTNSRNEATS